MTPETAFTAHRRLVDIHPFKPANCGFDVAWSPDFIERTERFEHPGLPPVDMRLLLQPEHAGLADRHFTGAAAALQASSLAALGAMAGSESGLGACQQVVIGAVGVGGAPGGHLDEKCAMDALDKVKDLLK